ncbi:hypothetical protein F01_420078 [Burkholderia cenocepacia]|nr:hypothetical protein F01_420078 [Burkholderia cenocepacia]
MAVDPRVSPAAARDRGSRRARRLRPVRGVLAHRAAGVREHAARRHRVQLRAGVERTDDRARPHVVAQRDAAGGRVRVHVARPGSAVGRDQRVDGAARAAAARLRRHAEPPAQFDGQGKIRRTR